MKILMGIVVLWSIGMLWLVYEISQAVNYDEYGNYINEDELE